MTFTKNISIETSGFGWRAVIRTYQPFDDSIQLQVIENLLALDVERVLEKDNTPASTIGFNRHGIFCEIKVDLDWPKPVYGKDSADYWRDIEQRKEPIHERAIALGYKLRAIK